jgi:hypothetical protein
MQAAQSERRSENIASGQTFISRERLQRSQYGGNMHSRRFPLCCALHVRLQKTCHEMQAWFTAT